MGKIFDRVLWFFRIVGIVIILFFIIQVIGKRIYEQLTRDPVVQVRLEQDGIVMLPSTIPVGQTLQLKTAKILATGAADRGVFVYAITDVAALESGYAAVSVAGLPTTSSVMMLENAIWLGMVNLAAGEEAHGEVIDAFQQPTGITDRGGGSQPILPWRSGSTATYGPRGVHDCGFSLTGWKAVDFFPAENQVYASDSGDVGYVCRDNTQVALKIGQNLYTHLVDTGQQIGDHFDQGQSLASMVPGSYNTTCGFADQQPNHYHVHFCFQPVGTSGYYGWGADGYTLNVAAQTWSKGADTVAIGGTLTANWTSASVNPPGPALGANLWDSLVNAYFPVVETVASTLPVHEDMGIAARMMATITPIMQLLYVMVFSNFDMTYVIWAFGIYVVLETVRISIAIARWIWKIIQAALIFFV